MRIKALLISALVAVAAMAQSVVVGEMTRVDTDAPAFYPQLAADGQTLVVTAQDYTGVSQINLATRQTAVLSTEPKAGYYAAAQPNVAINDRLQIVLNRNGRTQTLTPNGPDRRYLWPQLSPDGSQLVYTVSGRGTYVLNLNTNQVAYVGKIRAARWIDNRFVVGMVDKDNGYEVTESHLVVARNDGSTSQVITPDSVKAMYPSTAAGRIAFCTDKGEVYVLNVEIHP